MPDEQIHVLPPPALPPAPPAPQQVEAHVSVEPRPPGWDPLQGSTTVRTLLNTTFAGAVLFMFTMNYMQQGAQAEKQAQLARDQSKEQAAQAERLIEKVQTMLDKQEDRRTKEQEREIARSDKIHDANETRLRDWNKTNGERQALEADKLRLEMKGVAAAVLSMNEQLKLMTDRVRLQTMKD